MESKHTTEENFALSIQTELCSNCIFCISVCPFEALSIDENKKVKLNKEKCRLCGICYTTCPSILIKIAYYDVNFLTEKLKKFMEETNSTNLVITCRGSSPNKEQIAEKLKDNNYILFKFPCVGRVPLQFFLNAVQNGINKILVVRCEDDYCKYKKGSEISGNRVNAAKILFEDFGYDGSILSSEKNAYKITIDDTKCISCATCVNLCPYKAVRIETKAVVDMKKCLGCGLCIALCPNFAIKLENSEYEEIFAEIEKFTAEKSSPKILIIGCQWSEYSYLDNQLPNNVKFVALPCGGGVDILHILLAIKNGIDGIMIPICLEEQCNLEVGNKYATKRILKLNNILKEIGIKNKVKICNVSPKYLGMFQNELQEFANTLKEVKE